MMNDDETRNKMAPKGRNYKMAQKFLSTLDCEGQYTFQTFDDDKARRKARGKKPDPLARVFNGSLDDHWDALVKLNDKGAGIYVTVNRTDGLGRRENNILKVNAVFIDNDRAGEDPGFLYDWLCPPTMVVTTSPGKWHAYWVVEGMPLETFTPFQEWLAKEFDTDPDVKDVSRVMRLPGFMHRKGEPALVTLDHVDGAYQFSDLRLHSGFKPPRLRVVKKDAEDTGKFEASAEQVKGLLDHIIQEDPDYLNGRYHVWLELGMALHAWDEDEGYELWREVSEHSIHYDRAECEDKWETFDASRKGLKTLATYCHDFDYKISSHERASPEEDFAGVEKSKKVDSGVLFANASTIEMEAIDWAWENWLARGKFTLLAGLGGAGKTTIAMSLTATLTTGGLWPDGSRCAEKQKVVIWTAEDGLADGLVPKLKAAGADLSLVEFITGFVDNKGRPRSFQPQRDFPTLSRAVEALENVGMIILDPVVTTVSGDINKANEVREGLQPFVDLCVARQCIGLGITHFTKNSKMNDPTDRVIGSQAFSALARMTIVATYNPETDEGTITKSKTNIAASGGGFPYVLDLTKAAEGIYATVAKWGDFVEGSAKQIIESVENPDEEELDSVKALRDILASGPMEHKLVQKQMTDEGFTPKQLRRAKEKLNIDVHRQGRGKDHTSTWSLPYEVEDMK